MRKCLLFLFCLFFILTGCVSRQVPEVADWEEEVLIAEECGMDGLSCCMEEPQCKYGQTCCFNPTNGKETYCSDECICGELNKFCCDDLSCHEGLACANGRCKACGKEGEMCCGNDQCGGDLKCSNGVCLPCGVSGGLCCEGDDPCSKAGGERMECYDNICISCGVAGKDPCRAEPFCEKGNLLNNDSCIPCGKTNSPCCDKEVSDHECEDGLKCDLGFCG